MINKIGIAILFICSSFLAHAQLGIGPQKGKSAVGSGSLAPSSEEYIIAAISVSGSKFLDNELLISLSGLAVGDKITLPNDDKISHAIKTLWSQNLFADIEINALEKIGNKIKLDIHITERPRLSKFNFKGINDNDAKDLKDKTQLVRNKVITESSKKNAEVNIKKFYTEKGYMNAKVQVIEKPDTGFLNMNMITFVINKGEKVKVNQINIVGNDNANMLRLKKSMKNSKEMARLSLYKINSQSVYGAQSTLTKKEYFRNKGYLSLSKTLELFDPYFRYKFFSASKFNIKKYEEDKRAIVEYYNGIGYRDASVEKDTTYYAENGHLNIDLKIKEGHKYYFGDFSWKGNTKYTDAELTNMLGIKKGDVFNQDLLDQRTGKVQSMEGGDISSLYLDDGYLAFNILATERSVYNDTISFELQVVEGDQYTVKNVNISGNDKTHEHVIRRELRTYPGNKFSRADLIRSNREIANLGYFDAEKIGIVPQPNSDGTVDINYSVVEKSSDQLELQAGFGGGLGLTGTVGVSFNNFSLKNIRKKSAWDPLPMGDGQKLSLRGQANGKWYNSITASFSEPWLGGKKPTALSFSLYRTYFAGVQGSVTTGHMTTLGAGASISKRLRWPDDYFVVSYGLNYQLYNINNYQFFEGFSNGQANNFSFKATLARTSIDQPLYPRSGSNIMLSAQITPPYSLFNSSFDYANADEQARYKWIEYHKYRFTVEWYQKLKGNLVLKLAGKHGYLGYYNKDLQSPFERFQVGGDGINGFTVYGRDIVAHRGYEIYTPQAGATIFNKYTAEVRYPFSLNPSSTIYGLAFFEAANAWSSFKNFNPFELKRSTGLGVRIYLPMFGLLGLDYGFGIDRFTPGMKFSQAAKFTFMLGFEPD